MSKKSKITVCIVLAMPFIATATDFRWSWNPLASGGHRSLSIADRGMPTDDDDSDIDTTSNDDGVHASKEKSPYGVPSAGDTSDATPTDTIKAAPTTTQPPVKSANMTRSSPSDNFSGKNTTAVSVSESNGNSTLNLSNAMVNQTNSSAGDSDDTVESDDEVPGLSQWNLTNATKQKLYPDKNTTITIPKEQEQPDSWPFAIGTLFLVLASVLCILAGLRACRRGKSREGYEEIQSLVV